MPREFLYTQTERLKSEKKIAQLFKVGQSFPAYPLRLIYMPTEVESRPEFPIQVSVSVPKKKFKLAVDRNLLKRRLRESYRLVKNDVYAQLLKIDAQKKQIKIYDFMILYVAVDILPYAEIDKGMKKMMRKFIEEVKK